MVTSYVFLFALPLIFYAWKVMTYRFLISVKDQKALQLRSKGDGISILPPLMNHEVLFAANYCDLFS